MKTCLFRKAVLVGLCFCMAIAALPIPEAEAQDVPLLPDKYMWMQSHTDAAWMWEWPETFWVCNRTFPHNIEYMDQWPEYKFIYSTPQFYEWMKVIQNNTIYHNGEAVHNPGLYSAIKEKVANGQLVIVDGNWVEPDSNNAAGEGLVRQRLYGVRWFTGEFGDSENYKVVWIPDSFGFPASLPQIYKKSGAEYFVTTKLLWSSDTDMAHFPFYLYRWRSPDGSEIMSYQTCMGCNYPNYIPMELLLPLPADMYGSFSGQSIHNYDMAKARLANAENADYGFSTGDLPSEHSDFFSSEIILDFALLCGKGDHGEGPADEEAMAAVVYNNRPDYHIATPIEFFEMLEENFDTSRAPVWEDECMVETHRGTYTSKGLIKKLVREAESEAIAAETYSSLARQFGLDYPLTDVFFQPEVGWIDGYNITNFNQVWKLICFNHFHDILPGSSICPVYEDAKNHLGMVLDFCNARQEAAMGAMAENINTNLGGNGVIVIFNPLSWERSEVVKVALDSLTAEGKNRPRIFDQQDREVPSQVVESECVQYLVFNAEDVPSLGYKTYYYKLGQKQPEYSASVKIENDGKLIENDFYSVMISNDGRITSLFDKELGKEIIPDGDSIMLQIFKNVPEQYGAWNINKSYVDTEWSDKLKLESVDVNHTGPVAAQVDLVFSYFNENFDGAGTADPLPSRFVESIILYNDIKKIDIRLDYDWHGLSTLVKIRIPFDFNAAATKVFGDMPYGVYERPTVPSNDYEESKYEWPAQKWVAVEDSSAGIGLVMADNGRSGYDLRGCSDGVGVDTGNRILRASVITLPKDHKEPGGSWSDYYKQPENWWIETGQNVTYSISTYEGSWELAQAWHRGLELNTPLDTVVEEKHGGKLPHSASLMSVGNGPNVYVSAMKKCEDDNAYIIRLFENEGKDTTGVSLKLPFEIEDAHETNLLELEDVGGINFSGDTLSFDIGKWEIKTIKVFAGADSLPAAEAKGIPSFLGLTTVAALAACVALIAVSKGRCKGK